MRKLIIPIALVAFATVANAQRVQVGTYDHDTFIYAVNGSSNSGSINVQWSGYESPSFGRAGWRIVVWDTSAPQSPIASESFHASSYDSQYSRNFPVTPYQAVRVELYAVGDQYSNSPVVSNTVTTSFWVQPTNAAMGNNNYVYPVRGIVYGTPSNVATPMRNNWPLLWTIPTWLSVRGGYMN